MPYLEDPICTLYIVTKTSSWMHVFLPHGTSRTDSIRSHVQSFLKERTAVGEIKTKRGINYKPGPWNPGPLENE